MNGADKDKEKEKDEERYQRSKLLLRDCFLAHDKLSKRLKQLEFSRYPSKSIEPFLVFFHLLLEIISTLLNQFDKNISERKAHHTAELFSAWTFLKSYASAYLNRLEASRSSKVPQEIIRPFEDIVHENIQGTYLLFRPYEDHNYLNEDIVTLVTNATSRLLCTYYKLPELEAAQQFIKDFNKKLATKYSAVESQDVPRKDIQKLVIIGFPALEDSSFLQHSIIGHEIGHIIAGKRVDSIIEDNNIQRDFLSVICTELGIQLKNVSNQELNKLQKIYGESFERLKSYLQEIYCDFCEFWIFGWACLFAEYHFNLGRHLLDQPWPDHPPDRYRLRKIYDLATLDEFNTELTKLRNIEHVGQRITDIEQLVNAENEGVKDKIIQLTLNFIDERVELLQKDVRSEFSGLGKPGANLRVSKVEELCKRLEHSIPPNLIRELTKIGKDKVVLDVLRNEDEDQVGFRHIMIAAWVRRIRDLEREADIKEYCIKHNELDRLCLRATEVNFIHSRYLNYLKHDPANKKKNRVELGLEFSEDEKFPRICNESVPNRTEILNCMTREFPKDPEDPDGEPGPLVVTPLFSLKQISDGAVDVRLGNEFIVMKKTAFPTLDIGMSKEITEKHIGQYQDRYKMDFGDPFILHPNELVLGSTLEFICLPKDLFAYVLSRSSWGRLGLLIATATAVNPGYKGCLTLELINLGEVPLTLYAGLPIAQLILHKSSDGLYDASYKSPTGPVFANVHEKRLDNDFWPRPYKKRPE